MIYNTQRPHLKIAEYGRNIQNMVNHACSLESREERNTCAQAIINVMGQLKPHLRDVEEFKPKLWAHLFMLSDFQLDVDSPYPIPNKETFEEKPKPMTYPKYNVRYKHYGQTTLLLIDKACSQEDSPERDEFILSIVNMMKKAYLMYNRDTVSDDVILKNLNELSNGKLVLKDTSRIVSANEITRATRKVSSSKSNNNNKKKKFKKRY